MYPTIFEFEQEIKIGPAYLKVGIYIGAPSRNSKFSFWTNKGTCCLAFFRRPWIRVFWGTR